MVNPDIIIQEVRDDFALQESEKNSLEAILEQQLAKIEPVDFREKCGAESDKRLSKMDYSVVVIDELLKNSSMDICMREGNVMVYNGRYWLTIPPKTFRNFLTAAAVAMGAPGTSMKHHSFAEDLYKQFYLKVPIVEVKHDKVMMNLQNGTLEVTPTDAIVREFRKEDHLSHLLPFAYDPSATCPLFSKMINRNLPDQSCQKIIYEYIGSVFCPNLKLEKVVMFYGSGANGKSVLFEVIRALLGPENVCSYTLRNLTQKEGYWRAELAGKLLNYASEINSSDIDSAMFKALASHEPVEARRAYCNAFTMTDYAKMLFNMNSLPDTKDLTDSYFRRVVIIPFTVRIPDDEQDPDLATKIINTELAGIFNLVLEGLKRILKARRLTESDLVKQVVTEYRHDSDTVQQFLDMYRIAPGSEKCNLASILYSDYKDFARSICERPESLKSFANIMANKGFDRVRKSKGSYIYYSEINDDE